MPTLILGGNTFENCQPALIVGDTEVFRLRHRDDGGRLVLDLQLCDAAGQRLVQVVNGLVVHAAAGVTIRHGAASCEIIDAAGKAIARAEETAPETVRVTGTFGSPDAIVLAHPESLELPGRGTVRGCTFRGTGIPVAISAAGALSLGETPPPVARAGFRQKAAAPAFKQQGKRRR